MQDILGCRIWADVGWMSEWDSVDIHTGWDGTIHGYSDVTDVAQMVLHVPLPGHA